MASANQKPVLPEPAAMNTERGQGDQCSVSLAETGEGRCCEDNELKIVNLLNSEIWTMSLN